MEKKSARAVESARYRDGRKAAQDRIEAKLDALTGVCEAGLRRGDTERDAIQTGLVGIREQIASADVSSRLVAGVAVLVTAFFTLGFICGVVLS